MGDINIKKRVIFFTLLATLIPLIVSSVLVYTTLKDANLEDIGDNLITIPIIIGIASALIFGILSYLFASILYNNIKNLADRIDSFSNGDIAAVFDDEKSDISGISKSFLKLSLFLRQKFSELFMKVNDTSKSMDSLSSGMRELSVSLQQAETTINETSKDADQMIAKVLEIESEAGKALEISAKAASEAAVSSGEIAETASMADLVNYLRQAEEKNSSIVTILSSNARLLERINQQALSASIEAGKTNNPVFSRISDDLKRIEEDSLRINSHMLDFTRDMQNELNLAFHQAESRGSKAAEALNKQKEAINSFKLIPELIGNLNNHLLELKNMAGTRPLVSEEAKASLQEGIISLHSIDRNIDEIRNNMEEIRHFLTRLKPEKDAKTPADISLDAIKAEYENLLSDEKRKRTFFE